MNDDLTPSGERAVRLAIEVAALRARIARVEALAEELAHPDVDLIVPFERAVHRSVARTLRAALDGQQ